CEKRSVGVPAVDNVVTDIEAKLHERAEKEVSSLELGELVMQNLQRLDQVAYVRFASVYRQFKDIAQFMDEVKGLIKGTEGPTKRPARARAWPSPAPRARSGRPGPTATRRPYRAPALPVVTSRTAGRSTSSGRGTSRRC